MTLNEAFDLINEAYDLANAGAKFPVVGLCVEGDHVFITLRKILDGKPIDYTFAMERTMLRTANNPREIIAEHIRIANEELSAATEPLPVWTP